MGRGVLPFASTLDKSMSVDTFTHIDMRGAVILTLLKRRKELAIEFCEHCPLVCDLACRRPALRERALLQAWSNGMRV